MESEITKTDELNEIAHWFATHTAMGRLTAAEIKAALERAIEAGFVIKQPKS